jgi:hypothetical protein
MSISIRQFDTQSSQESVPETITVNIVDTSVADTVLNASISWGDGTTATVPVVNGVANGNVSQTFTLTAPHTYADDGNYTISLSVSGGGGQTSQTQDLTVSDAPLAAGSPPTILATPNTQFSGVVATFTDANATPTVANYTATIDWGDGTKATGTVALANGMIAVSGSHTYATQGLFAVAVTLSEGAGAASATADNTATVLQGQLAGNFTLTTALETIPDNTVLAKFVDSNSSDTASLFNASINWDDGTTSIGTVTGLNGQYSVMGGHDYEVNENEDPQFGLPPSLPVSVTITRSTDNAALTLSGTVNLTTDVEPLFQFSATQLDLQGAVGTLNIDIFDSEPNNLDRTRGTIDWGDGTTDNTGLENLDGNNYSTFALHQYVVPGSHKITVTVFDTDGGSASASETIETAPVLIEVGHGLANEVIGPQEAQQVPVTVSGLSGPTSLVFFYAPTLLLSLRP